MRKRWFFKNLLNLLRLNLLLSVLAEQQLLAPQIPLPSYLTDNLTKLKLEHQAIIDQINQAEQELVLQNLKLAKLEKLGVSVGQGADTGSTVLTQLAEQKLRIANLHEDLAGLLTMQTKNLHDMREIENSRISAPATSGCNSPHDCAEGATCDYANGACKACTGLGGKCNTTRNSYSECCKNLSCDHTGRCGKVINT